MATDLKPFTSNIRAHYDLSNDFYELFLDENMNYSCGVFESDDVTHEQAQDAKIEMALKKADIRPGQRVLDIGFGWGYPMRYAAEKYDVDVLGITLSKAQHDYVAEMLKKNPPKRGKCEIRIQGWEEFDEKVDRIYTLEVFEHFRKERYKAFFDTCYNSLPDDGRMLLQTNLWYEEDTLTERGIALEHEHILFAKFIGRIIFPGGQLCEPKLLVQRAEESGFNVTEQFTMVDHYIKTLGYWAGGLEANRRRAIEISGQEAYDNYMHYLTGCIKLFKSGHIDVMQFTCCK